MSRSIVFKSRGMQIIEHRLGRPLDEILRELYIERGMTVKQVAKELGVSNASVSTWMAAYGIPARILGSQVPQEATS